MKTLILAAACAGMLALSSASQAAQISSPMIYGTFDQVLAECAIFNGGNAAQTITVKLVSEFGDVIGPISCGGAKLAVGDACSLASLIDNTTAYACVATAGSIASLSGGLVFHKHVQDQFGVLVLHPIRFAPLR